jgi:16S rRNA (cytidine1402-2'-O)-methyltransferase
LNVATLFLVSTPIGNLGDVSARAADTLRSVTRILAEDTRRSRILADHVGARAPLVSLHAHNERERIETILGWLDNGDDVALVSDAGTPLVSDPGGRVVTAVVDRGHDVVPVPGPSAVLAALAGSGIVSNRFTFLGFPARKGAARSADLERVATSAEAVVLFEAPNRLVRLLEDLAQLCEAGRQASVGRELTKRHEEFVRGTLHEVARYYGERPPKGEVTLVVAPAPEKTSGEVDRDEATRLAEKLLEEGVKPSSAARELTDRLDLARNEAYRIVHGIQDARGASQQHATTDE